MKTIIDTKHDACRRACDEICSYIKKKPNAVLALTAGNSMEELFAMLSQRCASGEVSFKNVRVFQIAEYEGVDAQHSLRAWLEARLLDNTDISPENCVFISGESIDEYDALIAQCGGIDIAVIGIGDNCHIGFNEPATPFDSLTHRQKLTDSTRRMKAENFGGEDKVPEYGLTMGIKTIVNAKNLMVLAFGEAKAEPVFKMIYGKTITYVPASFVQIPLNVEVYLDREAAAKL